MLVGPSSWYVHLPFDGTLVPGPRGCLASFSHLSPKATRLHSVSVPTMANFRGPSTERHVPSSYGESRAAVGPRNGHKTRSSGHVTHCALTEGVAALPTFVTLSASVRLVPSV